MSVDVADDGGIAVVTADVVRGGQSITVKEVSIFFLECGMKGRYFLAILTCSAFKDEEKMFLVVQEISSIMLGLVAFEDDVSVGSLRSCFGSTEKAYAV